MLKTTSAKFGLILILCLYVLQMGLYAFFIPAWESPDEPSHYLYIRHLAQHGRPPGYPSVTRTGRFWEGGYATSMYEWYHPSGGYFWQAIAWRALDWINPCLTPDEFPEINLSFVQDPFKYPNLFVFNRASLWNLTCGELGLVLLRGLSGLLGIPLLYLVFLGTKQIFPDAHALAFTATGVVAFIPQFTFINATLRNDTFNNLLCTASVVVLLNIISPGTLTNAKGMLTGTMLGLAVLTKATALLLLPAVVIVFLVKNDTLKKRVGILFIAMLFAVGVVGIYILIFPEARLAFEYSLTHAKVRPELVNLSYLLTIPVPLRDMFWARFGWANVLGPILWIRIATLIGLAGGGISAIYGIYAHFTDRISKIQGKALAILVLIIFSNLLVIVRYNLYQYQPQGRFLFPSLLPLSVLSLWGAWQLVPHSLRRWLAIGLVVGMWLFNNMALFIYLIPAYYRF